MAEVGGGVLKKLSDAALGLILEFEVGGGQAYYNSALARPCWPGGASGPTIGVGYDLGYTPADRFREDWGRLPSDVRNRLAAMIGKKGEAARVAVKRVRDIVIPWDAAFAVFEARTIPYWIAQTLKAFPGADKLPPDAFGALVSLVFNRGPATQGKNREEMAKIMHVLADGVQAGDLEKIADALESMCRIWKGRGLDGLLRRRKAEATMVRNAK